MPCIIPKRVGGHASSVWHITLKASPAEHGDQREVQPADTVLPEPQPPILRLERGAEIRLARRLDAHLDRPVEEVKHEEVILHPLRCTARIEQVLGVAPLLKRRGKGLVRHARRALVLIALLQKKVELGRVAHPPLRLRVDVAVREERRAAPAADDPVDLRRELCAGERLAAHPVRGVDDGGDGHDPRIRIPAVAPVRDHEPGHAVLQSVGDGVVEDDVAPEHHDVPALGAQAVDLQEVVEVDARGALRRDLTCVFPSATGSPVRTAPSAILQQTLTANSQQPTTDLFISPLLALSNHLDFSHFSYAASIILSTSDISVCSLDKTTLGF